MGKRLGRGVDSEPIGSEFDGRKTTTGAGNGGSKCDRRVCEEGLGRADDQSHVAASADRVDAPNDAECGDDAGEHQATLVSSVSMSSPMAVVQSRLKRGIWSRDR